MKEERKFKRQCNCCREYKTKEELIRITKDYKTGEYLLNNKNSVQGRSIYLCKNENCIKNFLKNKKKLRSLGAQTCKNIEEILDTVLKN